MKFLFVIVDVGNFFQGSIGVNLVAWPLEPESLEPLGKSNDVRFYLVNIHLEKD